VHGTSRSKFSVSNFFLQQNFRTVDPAIYALSDYTRFSRIYKDALPHSVFNPREVGAYVALRILSQQLDPSATRPHTYATPSAESSVLAKPYVPPPRTSRPPLPVFLLPRAVSCDLPGGLNYFCARLPVQPEEAVSYLTNSAMAEAAGDMRGAGRNRNFVLKVSTCSLMCGCVRLCQEWRVFTIRHNEHYFGVCVLL
jgi:hypothetical protein